MSRDDNRPDFAIALLVGETREGFEHGFAEPGSLLTQRGFVSVLDG
jgi:hypothetical protein